MVIRITYQAASYAPELVTGVYVRRQRVGLYVANEAASETSRRFEGKPGHGPTLRTWETDGTDLPQQVRADCDAEPGVTLLWHYIKTQE